MSIRPPRSEIFMNLAREVARRSTCPRAKVGAVIVNADNNKILSLGYNGSLKGWPHCDDSGCYVVGEHCVRADHAERNALDCLDGHYNNLSIYCTHMPCLTCTRALIKDSVKHIYYTTWYVDLDRDELYFNENNKITIVYQYLSINGNSMGASLVFLNGKWRINKKFREMK